jgi:hypothetical protein
VIDGVGGAQVGDGNGDGVADVAIAVPSTDGRGRRDAGVVYVLFGGSPLARVDVRSAPRFRTLGPRQGARRPAPVFEPYRPPVGAMAGSPVAGAAPRRSTSRGSVRRGSASMARAGTQRPGTRSPGRVTSTAKAAPTCS